MISAPTDATTRAPRRATHRWLVRVERSRVPAREVDSRRGGSGRRRSGAGECRAASQTLRHENADEAERDNFSIATAERSFG